MFACGEFQPIRAAVTYSNCCLANKLSVNKGIFICSCLGMFPKNSPEVPQSPDVRLL